MYEKKIINNNKLKFLAVSCQCDKEKKLFFGEDIENDVKLDKANFYKSQLAWQVYSNILSPDP